MNSLVEMAPALHLIISVTVFHTAKMNLDENNCHVVEFPKNRQYKETLPPIGRKEGKMTPTEVEVAADIMLVTNIQDSSMTWSCKLQLNLTWLDGRLRWRDLRNNSNLNVLLFDDFSPKIWVASLIFANSHDNEITTVDEKTSLTVDKKGDFILSPLDEVNEVAYYEGAENPITYRREFSKEFSCEFQLFNYPFDTQECRIRLTLPDSLVGLIRLRPSELVYSGPVKLIQFNIKEWKWHQEDNGISVTLKMQRRYHHHLFTTFLPTFGLMIMCQSTLYLRADHFKTKSGVTLTTMLVMYTLYQSVSIELPPTAFIKMIDIWLIFGLIMPFSVFFLLVMIDHLPVPKPDQPEKPTLFKVRKVLVVFGHYLLPLIIIMFACFYLITAVIIYNNDM